VEGAPPYRRCSATPSVGNRSGTSGSLGFSLHGTTLVLTPGASPPRLALFSGAGLGGGPTASDLANIARARADVLVVLGGLGRSHPAAERVLTALESLGVLVLVIPGGCDGIEFERLLGSARPRLVNAAGLRRITLGHDTLVPWAGSELGRYAVDSDGCGFGDSDLAEALRELGPSGPAERRWLLSWQSPSSSRLLGQLVAKPGFRGVLSAWPAAVPGVIESWEPPDGLVVPRAWGPRIERADGTLAPLGVLALTFGPDGPQLARYSWRCVDFA
jgi:hypothetical protein